MKAWIVWQIFKTVVATTAAAFIIWLTSDDAILPFYASLFLKIVAVVIFLLGILLAALREIKTRKYECSACHRKFSPDVRQGWNQKCPICGGAGKCIGREIPDGKNY